MLKIFKLFHAIDIHIARALLKNQIPHTINGGFMLRRRFRKSLFVSHEQVFLDFFLQRKVQCLRIDFEKKKKEERVREGIERVKGDRESAR